MITYIARRILISIPVLLAITFVLFLLSELMPGDAVVAMMSPEAPVSRAALETLRSQLGLDQPWPVRYARWLWQLLHGHLGYSFITFEPVTRVIASRIPATLELMGISMLLSLILGVILGTISAVKQYSLTDFVLTVLGFAGQSIPVFFLGLALIYLFGLRLRWFPVSGSHTPGAPPSPIDHLSHLFLPLLSLSIMRIAVFMRHTRSSLLEVLHSDFLNVARAKGISERAVIIKHGLRNALIPIITIVGLNIPVIFAGAVIIESIFQWPGIGLLYVKAVQQRDHPMIMGLALMSAVVVLVSNLLTDIAYAYADPRIRYD